MTFKLIAGVLRLEQKTIGKVSKAKAATRNAYIAILASAVIWGALNSIVQYAGGADLSTAEFLVGLLVLALLFWPLIVITIVWLLTGAYRLLAKAFGGKGSYKQLFRVKGHSHALWALAWIPFAYWPLLLYQLAIDVQTVRVVERLSLGRSVAVVALSALIIGGLLLGLLLLIMLLALGLGLGQPALL
jgi:hypothetical protein